MDQCTGCYVFTWICCSGADPACLVFVFVRLSWKSLHLKLLSLYHLSYDTTNMLLSGCYLHRIPLWQPMTHPCPLQTGDRISLYNFLSSDQRSQRIQVLRQTIVFGWSCVPCIAATALVTVCDSNQAEPPTSTRATHKPGSKDASPALEPASESVAAFFIRWTFCRESATAVSVSLETLSSAGVRPSTWARMPKMVIQ